MCHVIHGWSPPSQVEVPLKTPGQQQPLQKRLLAPLQQQAAPPARSGSPSEASGARDTPTRSGSGARGGIESDRRDAAAAPPTSSASQRGYRSSDSSNGAPPIDSRNSPRNPPPPNREPARQRDFQDQPSPMTHQRDEPRFRSRRDDSPASLPPGVDDEGAPVRPSRRPAPPPQRSDESLSQQQLPYAAAPPQVQQQPQQQRQPSFTKELSPPPPLPASLAQPRYCGSLGAGKLYDFHGFGH